MLVNSFLHANTKSTNYCQSQQKNYLKVMIIDGRKALLLLKRGTRSNEKKLEVTSSSD